MDYRPETGEFVLNPGEMGLLNTTSLIWRSERSEELLVAIDAAERRVKAIDPSQLPGNPGRIEAMRQQRAFDILAGMRRVIGPHATLTDGDFDNLLGKAS